MDRVKNNKFSVLLTTIFDENDSDKDSDKESDTLIFTENLKKIETRDDFQKILIPKEEYMEETKEFINNFNIDNIDNSVNDITKDVNNVSDFFEIVDLKIHGEIIGHIVIDKYHKDIAETVQGIINSGGINNKRVYTGKPQKISDLYFKTERCVNGYGNPSACSYGHRCKFAHTEDELKKHQERSTKIDNYI